MTTITRVPAFVIADLPRLTGWEARTDAAIARVRELLPTTSFDKPLPKKPRVELKDFSFARLQRAAWTTGGAVAGAVVGVGATAALMAEHPWMLVLGFFYVPVAAAVGGRMVFEELEERTQQSAFEASWNRTGKELGYQRALAAWEAERDACARRVGAIGGREIQPLMRAIDDAPDAPARDHAIRAIAAFADDLLRNHAPKLDPKAAAWLERLVDSRKHPAATA